MYGKSALGSVLPLAGLAAAPEMMPGIPLARALQATAGAGFLVYCLVAFGLLVARLCIRTRASPTGPGAVGRGERTAVSRP
jgi:hypothetical protein